jgi:septal ring factor EnvC (AmiA/AmiB activator)
LENKIKVLKERIAILDHNINQYQEVAYKFIENIKEINSQLEKLDKKHKT